jgi:hypothetical protein
LAAGAIPVHHGPEVFSHDRALTSGPIAVGLLAAQLMAMPAAVALLFTRVAREWFRTTDS